MKKRYLENQLKDRSKTIPILSFPCIQKLNINVTELVNSSDYQHQVMEMIAKEFPVSAITSAMDLSVEAEAFGAKIRFADNEIPTVVNKLFEDIHQSVELVVPSLDAGRAKVYIEAVRKAKQTIIDKPVFAGVIGPFSLAGRLLDMTEIMMDCYDEPELVHGVLKKCSEFITKYIKAFKEAGADGVLMAEPAAGLLSPAICQEFSSQYVKEIISSVRDDNFVFVYHNCGNTVPLYQSLLDVDADVYHFGNAIDIEDILKLMPSDKIVMGNIDPISIKDGNSQSIKERATALLDRCNKYPNFVISTGCDLPPATPWENIESYFNAILEYHNK